MIDEVWTIAEHDQGVLSEAAQEILTEGQRIATKLGATHSSVLMGNKVAHLVDQIAGFGAGKVYLAESPVLSVYAADAFVPVLACAVEQYHPKLILMGHTPLGRDLAATLAGRLRLGLVSDCSFISVDVPGEIQAIRPVFNGRASATFAYTSPRSILATLRTGVISVSQPASGRTAETVVIDVAKLGIAQRTESLGVIKGELSQVDLIEADIVVAGGRGVGGPENFRLIEQLAAALGGKVGGSRYAVDAGWISRDQQIGVSGKIVAPSLYVACGISGAVHHLEGMRESKTIIAINKDRAAPICKVADLTIVGDVLEVVPAMIERLQKRLPVGA